MKPLSFAALGVCMLGLNAVADAVPLRDPVGAVEKLESTAEAHYASQARPLGEQSKVYFRDTLRTGDAARLQARLADDSVLTLGENAEIEIDEFVYEPRMNQGSLDLSVVSGAFLFVGGHIEDSATSKVEITTPLGTLGIRGTTVWGGHIDGGYGVLVLDGEVEVRTAGGTVLLQAGQGTMVFDAAQGPEAAAPWSEDRTNRAVATISFPQ